MYQTLLFYIPWMCLNYPTAPCVKSWIEHFVMNDTCNSGEFTLGLVLCSVNECARMISNCEYVNSFQGFLVTFQIGLKYDF